MNHLLVMLYKFLSLPDMKIPDSVVDFFLSKWREMSLYVFGGVFKVL